MTTNLKEHFTAQREDGFYQLTRMCKANRKHLGHWYSQASTKSYINELLSSPEFRGNRRSLLQITRGGPPALQGTWGHPLLAIHLARWISPAFAIWCDVHIFQK